MSTTVQRSTVRTVHTTAHCDKEEGRAKTRVTWMNPEGMPSDSLQTDKATTVYDHTYIEYLG